MAAVAGDGVKVYDVAESTQPVTLMGKFSGIAAWSGNGGHLVLATEGGGITVYENDLSENESQLAANWWKALRPAPAVTAAARPLPQAVDGYAQFSSDAPPRAELATAIDRALRDGRTDKPVRWQDYEPYVKDQSARRAAEEAVSPSAGPEDIGIAIFQLKKALQANPGATPVQFALARAYRLSGQTDEADKLLLATVRADAGRTDLTGAALNELATLREARGDTLSALHCLVAALYLDRADPRTLARVGPVLKAQKFEEQAERLARAAATVPGTARADLPALPDPGELKKLSATEVYQKAVWSVVLVKTDSGSGSGVCVGRPDIVLTNNHVVEGDGPIEVHPFALKGKTPVRLGKVTATVLARDVKNDLAVLKLERAPETLEPLSVAAVNPAPGGSRLRRRQPRPRA